MPRTGNSASVGRQSSLRRGANERQGSGRRLYGVRRLQMAAELLRHGVFLDKDRAPRRASAWTFLLDGTEHGSFFGVELCRPQPSRNAKRWDAAEWATYYNFNLSAMAESVDFVLRAGPQRGAEHNRSLIEFMY